MRANACETVRVLMLGSNDTKLLEERTPANGWVQERHIAYGERLGRLCVVVKTTGRKWDVRHISPKVTVYATNSWTPLSGLWSLYRLACCVIRSEEINLIVTADVFGCAWIAWLLKLRFRIPLALQCFGDFVDNPFWLRERFQHRMLNPVAKWLLRRVGAIRVHSEFKGKTALWVGRLVKQKDLPTLLRAAQHVLRRHPGARFRLAGAGPEAGRMQRFCRALGVERQVDFLGQIPCGRLQEELARCQLVVSSSIYEDAARVLVEVALAGRPIVTTAVCGAELAVEEGKTGFIIPVGDDAALADRICALFDSPALLPAMGRAARRRVEGIWQFEDQMEQLTAWWQNAAGPCEGRAPYGRKL